jgi:hypothetical protein
MENPACFKTRPGAPSMWLRVGEEVLQDQVVCQSFGPQKVSQSIIQKEQKELTWSWY